MQPLKSFKPFKDVCQFSKNAEKKFGWKKQIKIPKI